MRRMVDRLNSGEKAWKTYLSNDPIPSEFAVFFTNMRKAGLTLLLDEEYTVLCFYAAKGGYYSGERSTDGDREACDRCLRKVAGSADQCDKDPAGSAGFRERVE